MNPTKITYEDLIENFPNLIPQHADTIFKNGGMPTCALDFYQDIFKTDLAPQHADPNDYKTGEYAGIALEINQTKTGRKARRRTVTRELTELFTLIETSDNFCLISPISYAGKARTNKNARYLHALALEIDELVPDSGIRELFYLSQRQNRPMPQPTYIVCSGSGVHLYWIFERPIPLYATVFEQLSAAKRAITPIFWDKQITKSWEKPQYESLNQPFRCVGTRTKTGKRTLAFKIGHEITLDYLNKFLDDETKITTVYPKGKVTLKEAQTLWPDWYQRRIIEKQDRGHFTRHPGIYHNWKQKILKNAKVGTRYYCLENLCSLAVQCRIDPETIEKDCNEIAEHFETLTTDEKNHFTKDDVISALSTYHNPNESTWARRIEYISNRTGIPLTPNIRKGNTQELHLKIARAHLEILNDAAGHALQGAPTKQHIVKNWRKQHPTGRKIDCQRATRLSRPTVLKWWNS